MGQGLLKLRADLFGNVGIFFFPAVRDAFRLCQTHGHVVEFTGSRQLFGQRIFVFVAHFAQYIA